MIGEFQPSRRGRWWLVSAVIGLAVLAALVVALVRHTQRRAPFQSAVAVLLQTGRTNRPIMLQQVVDLGPEGRDQLSAIIGYHDSALRREFVSVYPSLPPLLKAKFRDPAKDRLIHFEALGMVQELGPAYARPLTSALCEAIGEEPSIDRHLALAALYWSVPDSPKAVAAVSRALADLGNDDLPAPTAGYSNFWGKLPRVLPLMTGRLRLRANVPLAAGVLGSFGTNAAAAIPALIDVCDAGAASPPGEADVVRNQMLMPTNLPAATAALWASNLVVQSNATLAANRIAGLEALGRIGLASPPVLAAVNRRLSDSNDEVRIEALHQPFGFAISNALAGMALKLDVNYLKIPPKLGELGEQGRDALQWLRQYLSIESNQLLPIGDSSARMQGQQQQQQRKRFVSNMAANLRQEAILAICQINPAETAQYIDDLLPWLRVGRPTAEVLAHTTNPTAVIPKLEAILQATNSGRPPILAAEVLLRLQPDHGQALEFLRTNAAQGSWSDRVAAATALWRRTGETQLVLAVCTEALRSNQRAAAPAVIRTLTEMGPAARPAIPALKALVLTPAMPATGAGVAELLLQLAPGELPSVRRAECHGNRRE